MGGGELQPEIPERGETESNGDSKSTNERGPSSQAADPLPLPLREVKTGRNHLNEEFTPLLPTGIGERF
jgi:hypothetical protein